MEAEMTDNRPVHTISYGALRICVWRNPGDFYTLIPVRRYMRDDVWHDSNSFGEFDLPLLAKAISDAHSWIQTHRGTVLDGIALPVLPSPKEPKPDVP
jgi:hypothetical protein